MKKQKIEKLLVNTVTAGENLITIRFVNGYVFSYSKKYFEKKGSIENKEITIYRKNSEEKIISITKDSPCPLL